jgi:uncharacterized protein
MRLTIFALLVCCWAVPALAADFQIPPTPDRFVTDNAGALSSGARATIESTLQTYAKSTGHQILVWIGQTTGDVPLETWTVETVNKWKVGRRSYDDGAVLFLFMQDHKIRIEVGYGLEGALTDADSDRIIRHVIAPAMRSGDMDGAVSAGVAAMLATISPSYKGVTPPPESGEGETTNLTSPTGLAILAVLGLGFGFLLLMVILQAVWFRRHGYTVTRHGPTFWGGPFIGGGFAGGGFGGGGFGGGGFSAGGGSFGGGGASGGW